MYAQILVDGEMEVLVGRVTDAVVTALADLAAGLEDPELRAAMGALVITAHHQLALAPVDPDPLVRAILHGDPVPVDVPVEVPVEVPGPPRLATPAYWPAVPAISDQLFAQHAANTPKEADEHLRGPDGPPPVPQAVDQEHASGSPVEPAGDSTAEPAGDSPVEPAGDSTAEPAGDSPVEPAGDSTAQRAGDSPVEPAGDSTAKPAGDSPVEPAGDSTAEPGGDSPVADAPGPEPFQVQGGRFHPRPLARRKKLRQR